VAEPGRRRRLASVLAVVAAAAALGASSRPAAAWGSVGHRLVVERAVRALDGELGAFARAHEEWLKERSLDPDTLWKDRDGRAEEVRHFLDVDLYGAGPEAVPRDLAAARARFGDRFVTETGLLPWRIDELACELALALGDGQRELALDLMGHLSHYAADLSQPFHLLSDYDGQSTGQRGIHRRYETDLVERHGRAIGRALGRRPVEAEPVADPLEQAFAAMAGAPARVEAVLAADRRAAAGHATTSSTYHRLLYASLREQVVADLERGARLTASLWLWAWQEAGRPALGGGRKE
jgi:hypothetical protein